MRIFQDLMPTLRWAPSVVRRRLFNEETETIENLCRMTMESDGEFTSLLLAERILNAYEKLDDEARLDFFALLHDEYDVDIAEIKAASETYERNDDAQSLLRLTRAAEPGRRELLRRINLTPDGTRRLVKMREHLLAMARQRQELKKIDTDFHHMFNAWFNRGFLLMQPIDWTTPAHILEKIIAYEAVHEIESWAALRSRLEPPDRYCYAFFHPSMEDEPLVFVWVALTDEIPHGISEILQRDTEAADPENASCAIFYSISNCHKGLAGVSFGNFLIKQVATSLQMRFPQLKKFATISPVPGLRRWLEKKADSEPGVADLLTRFSVDADDALSAQLEQLTASYFLQQKTEQLEPLDPVARFHLKNGAVLERINILGNPSPAGMERSLGTMVNYVYNLSRVEENHEKYIKNHRVIAGSQVKKALPR